MLHPSTKKLVEKLFEMTFASKISWKEGDDSSCYYDTEGYRVTIGQTPSRLVLLDAGGRVLETASDVLLNGTLDGDGISYAAKVDQMVSEARRQFTGSEDAINRIVLALDLDGDGIPDVDEPVAADVEEEVDAVTETSSSFPDQHEMASRVAALAERVNGGVTEQEAAPAEDVSEPQAETVSEEHPVEAVEVVEIGSEPEEPAVEASVETEHKQDDASSGLGLAAAGLAAAGGAALVSQLASQSGMEEPEAAEGSEGWSVPESAEATAADVGVTAEENEIEHAEPEAVMSFSPAEADVEAEVIEAAADVSEPDAEAAEITAEITDAEPEAEVEVASADAEEPLAAYSEEDVPEFPAADEVPVEATVEMLSEGAEEAGLELPAEAPAAAEAEAELTVTEAPAEEIAETPIEETVETLAEAQAIVDASGETAAASFGSIGSFGQDHVSEPVAEPTEAESPVADEAAAERETVEIEEEPTPVVHTASPWASASSTVDAVVETPSDLTEATVEVVTEPVVEAMDINEVTAPEAPDVSEPAAFVSQFASSEAADEAEYVSVGVEEAPVEAAVNVVEAEIANLAGPDVAAPTDVVSEVAETADVASVTVTDMEAPSAEEFVGTEVMAPAEPVDMQETAASEETSEVAAETIESSVEGASVEDTLAVADRAEETVSEVTENVVIVAEESVMDAVETEVVTEAAGPIEAAVEQGGDFLSSMASGIGALASQAKDNVGHAVSAASESVGEAVSSFTEPKSGADDGAEPKEGLFSGIASGVSAFASQAKDAAEHAVESTTHAVGDAVSSFTEHKAESEAPEEKNEGLLSGLASGVGAFASHAKDAAEHAVESTTHAVGDAVSSFTEHKADPEDKETGFMSSLASGIGAVASQAKEMAESAVEAVIGHDDSTDEAEGSDENPEDSDDKKVFKYNPWM